MEKLLDAQEVINAVELDHLFNERAGKVAHELLHYRAHEDIVKGRETAFISTDGTTVAVWYWDGDESEPGVNHNIEFPFTFVNLEGEELMKEIAHFWEEQDKWIAEEMARRRVEEEEKRKEIQDIVNSDEYKLYQELKEKYAEIEEKEKHLNGRFDEGEEG